MAGALDSVARARELQSPELGRGDRATERTNIPRENDAPAAAKSKLPARLLYPLAAPFDSNHMTYMSYRLLMALLLYLPDMTYMSYPQLDVPKRNSSLNMTYMS